jgi:hypothetical protein
MHEPRKRLDQHPSKLAAALLAVNPAQRDRRGHDQMATGRRVEALRDGRADDAQDPVIRSLARWRAAIVDGA